MNKAPRILAFDIEASNLNGNFGFCLCIGYMWLHEKKVRLISIRDDARAHADDPTNDRELIERFRPVIEQANLAVYHYGQRYDLPFLQTRCFEHGLLPLPKVTSVDTWRIARDTLKLNSNRLETISRSIPYLRADEAPRKTTLNHKAWVRGAAGHIPSIKEIEHHCRQDVLVLRDVYLRLRPFMNNHPNLSLLIGEFNCPACGSRQMHRKGFLVTQTTKKQRWLCSNCGSSTSTPISKRMGDEDTVEGKNNRKG